MKKLFYIFAILILVGCTKTVPVIEEPILPVVGVDGTVLCEHRYDSRRSFAYTPPVKAYEQVLMGQTLVTYEFLLTNGQKHFLSGMEQDNYHCKQVE